MQSKFSKTKSLIFRVVSSRYFWWAVVGYFIINSLWLVFSALYPAAFDEDFHLGIIQIYSQQWSPFLTQQPEGANIYGALVTDPSYLFHYLMSFPLRLIAHFTDSLYIQVILLRLLNVGFMLAGLYIIRRTLLALKASNFTAHVILAIFVMIPIVPYLAAHINYDNVVIPLTFITLLATLRVYQGWSRGDWAIKQLWLLAIVGLFTSVIKYTYLPMLAASGLFLLVYLVIYLRRGSLQFPTIKKDFKRISKLSLTGMGIAFVIGLGLFVQRYGVNYVQYGALKPDCGKVLSVEGCSEYGPWGRNYRMNQTIDPSFAANPAEYAPMWFSGLWHRSFFAVAGPTNNHDTQRPLLIFGWTVAVIAVIGGILLLATLRRQLRNNAGAKLVMLTVGLYVVILFADGFSQYGFTGQAVAVNGRYLLPILPLICLLYARAFGIVLRRIKLNAVVPALALFVLLIGFTQGGGAATWIIQSKQNWQWQDSSLVRSANSFADNALSPLIIDGKQQWK